MNNLKRVLSLVLALVMIVGVMAVASATEFTDQKEITHTEAVDTMNALGVILGKDDGSFDPTANITRGEMSTIIARILNSGKLPAVGSNSEPHFTDIDTHWARNYIEYCANLGIVAGRGDGTFDPNADVTYAEAAKMLLVAAGYQADFYGFVGKDWELNTNSVANQKGLYDQLGNPDTSKPVNRDNAAQMAFNALYVQPMVVNYSKDRTTGAVTEIYDPDTKYPTVLKKYFGAETEYSYIAKVSYSADKKQYTYTFDNDLFGAAPSTAALTDTTMTSDKDYSDLYGQLVAVIYKKETNGTKTLFGISGKGVVLFDGTADDFDASDYTFNRTATTSYVAFNKGAYDADATAIKGWFAMKAFDNNDDNKVDAVLYYPVYVSKVAYVSDKTFYLANDVENAGTVTKSKVNVYDGIAKDDWVVETKKANTLDGLTSYVKVEEANIIKGKVTATQKTKAQIDGTYYDLAVAENADYDEDSEVRGLIGKEPTLVLVNGKVAAIQAPAAATTTTVFGVVIKTATGVSALDEKAQVRVLKTDGTTEDLDVAYSATLQDDYEGKLVSYTKNSSTGLYTLTLASGLTTTADGYTKVGVAMTDANDATTGAYAKIGTYTISADAVVFVKDSDGNYSVITGAALKKYAASAVTGNNAQNAFIKLDKGTNYERLVLAYVTLDPGASLSSKTYGYVTSTVTNVSATASTMDMYTTDGAKEGIKVTSHTGVYALTQDTVVQVVDNGDETYGTTGLTVEPVAVTKWDASTGEIQLTELAGGVYNTTVTSSTKVLYIDSTNRTEGTGAIQLASVRKDENKADNYVVNALVVMNGNTITVLVVDIANEMSAAAVKVATHDTDAKNIFLK